MVDETADQRTFCGNAFMAVVFFLDMAGSHLCGMKCRFSLIMDQDYLWGDCLFSIVALTCIMVKCHHCFHMDGIQKLKKSRSNVAIDQQIMQISALSEIICRGHQHIVVGA